MDASRRGFLAGMTASVAGCSLRQKDGPYPSRDIEFIIPTGAGGGADMYARLIGTAMEPALPQSVNVIPRNVASGGGGKGVVELFNAAPDGYTIGILNIPGIFVLQQRRHLPFDFTKFTWLGSFTTGEQYGMAVGWDSPIRDFDDLRRLSRQRELTFASTGPEGMGYTATQIATRILGLPHRVVTGYRGSSDYVVAAMRGDTDAVVAAITTLHRLQKGKVVRVIAAFGDEPDPTGAPNALDLHHPELAELRGDRVVAGPPGLPDDCKAILSQALTHAWTSKALLAWADSLGETIAPRTADETAAMIGRRKAFLEAWLGIDGGARQKPVGGSNAG